MHDRSARRRFLYRTLVLAGILAAIAGFAGFPSPAAAANCGALNQRPCKVWERIPSCDKGLIEYVGPSRCAPPPSKIGPIKIPKIVCGAENQRPCTVVERIPSCDSGLVEDFVLNKCVKNVSANSLVELGKSCLKQYGRVAQSLARVASCSVRSGLAKALQGLFPQGDPGAVKAAVLASACRGEIQSATQVIRNSGFRALSIGIGGDLGAGLRANSEFFLAVNADLSGRGYIYETLGFQFGNAVGGSVNGIVTAYKDAPHELAGDGQGFSVSLKALGGAGGGIGFSYENGTKKPYCSSISAAAGAGAEENTGALGRSTTLLLH